MKQLERGKEGSPSAMARATTQWNSGSTARMPARPRSFFLGSLVVATVVLLAGAWLSSGTMAPYAATLHPDVVRIQPPCEYLTNIDHFHFQATFWMLQGRPRSQWEGSVVLQRLLYPLLAFPLMSLLGFENGGFATNLIVTVAVFWVFVFFVRRAIGERAAVAASWLLATYPGIAYWVGLPYSYVWIVPGSLLLTMLLCKLSTVSTNLSVAVVSLAMGVVFWGYDLFPFFATAAVLVLLRQRRFWQVPICLGGMAAALCVLFVGLNVLCRVPLRNPNTEVYWVIMQSLSSKIDYPEWSKLIVQVPSILLENFFDSNFFFLPLMFLSLVLLSLLRHRRLEIQTPELEILLAILLVFLANNLAPPYPGWQLRGVWIARLYQPSFVAFVLYAVRGIEKTWGAPDGAVAVRIHAILVSLAVLGNACIVFGPVLQLPLASKIYYRFYRHSPPDSLQRNLSLHGRRPLGVCKATSNIR